MAFSEMSEHRGSSPVLLPLAPSVLNHLLSLEGENRMSFSKGWGNMVYFYHYLVIRTVKKKRKKKEIRLHPNVSSKCPSQNSCIFVAASKLMHQSDCQNSPIKMSCPRSTWEVLSRHSRHKGAGISSCVPFCVHSPPRLRNICIKSIIQPMCQGNGKHSILEEGTPREGKKCSGIGETEVPWRINKRGRTVSRHRGQREHRRRDRKPNRMSLQPMARQVTHCAAFVEQLLCSHHFGEDS